MQFHKRVAEKCKCKNPLVCSVLENKFWCGKCGKSLEPLSRRCLRRIKNACQSTSGAEEAIDRVILDALEM